MLCEAIIRVLIGGLVLQAFECVLTHTGEDYIRMLKKAQYYIPLWLSSVDKVCKRKLDKVGRKVG